MVLGESVRVAGGRGETLGRGATVRLACYLRQPRNTFPPLRGGGPNILLSDVHPIIKVPVFVPVFEVFSYSCETRIMQQTLIG